MRQDIARLPAAVDAAARRGVGNLDIRARTSLEPIDLGPHGGPVNHVEVPVALPIRGRGRVRVRVGVGVRVRPPPNSERPLGTGK